MVNQQLCIDHIENEFLENIAREVRKIANSHRRFDVGTAFLGFNGTIYGVFSGANMKPKPNGQKICAEGMVGHTAIECGFLQICKIAVCGPVQTDSRSGKDSPTLHPCGSCRDYLRNLQRLGVVTENLPILTYSTYKGGAKEQHTLMELLKFHNERS